MFKHIMLDNEQFLKIYDDPTKRIEGKIRRCVRKIKSKVSKDEFSNIYPTGYSPGTFYGNAKMQKLPKNGNINDLPLRPIISNIDTASYHLSNYLAKFLLPQSQSEYTVKNTKEFIEQSKNISAPENSKLVSFDISSLFMNVSLDYTIDIILRRVYRDKEINTMISCKELKELLLLCTKNVHFSYKGQLYSQTDGMVMDPPLGPVIPGIFMVELERNVIPKLSLKIATWKLYVADTIAYVKTDASDYVLFVLKSFHSKTKFTYEIEDSAEIALLDALLVRKGNDIETTVYRKPTHNGMYLHCDSFAHES